VIEERQGESLLCPAVFFASISVIIMH
jgi:hypothetical protein